MYDFTDLQQAVIKGKYKVSPELVANALAEGSTASEILNDGLIAGLDVVGVKFKSGEYYLPQVLLSTKAMKAGLELIRPLIASTGVEPIGTLLIGTVSGDLHDIGKNLVSMMFEGAGFKVIDLGVDVAPDKFIAAIKENKPDIVGMSALLTTTMLEIKATITAIEEAGLRSTVKIMVGGAPVSERFTKEVGADGYAPDAVAAVAAAKAMVMQAPAA